jgi:hypothetical protein
MFPPRVTIFSTRINGQGMLTAGARLIRVVVPHRQPFWRTRDPETANPASGGVRCPAEPGKLWCVTTRSLLELRPSVKRKPCFR